MKKLIILSTTFLLVGCCQISNPVKKHQNQQVPSQREEDNVEQEMEDSVDIALRKNTFTRDNYKFKEWNTQADVQTHHHRYRNNKGIL